MERDGEKGRGRDKQKFTIERLKRTVHLAKAVPAQAWLARQLPYHHVTWYFNKGVSPGQTMDYLTYLCDYVMICLLAPR